jgi:hypothetical protein
VAQYAGLAHVRIGKQQRYSLAVALSAGPFESYPNRARSGMLAQHAAACIDWA